jgi:hypothetical protein
MKKHRKIILFTFFIIIIIFTLLKIYVFVFETNFQDLNAKNIKQVKNDLDNKDSFSFALVGNVENSIDVFDEKIMPLINKDNVDFVIFAGNSLLDGGNDKYGAFYKTLNKIKVPAIIAVGDNEVSDRGSKRFHKYFGPYYFSFGVANSYFIFLDTTGETSEEWQKEWLVDELEKAKDYENKFIISNKHLITTNKTNSILSSLPSNKYKINKEYSDYLKQLFTKHNVTAVLSSNETSFSETKLNKVNYLSTGGGGGLSLSRKSGDYGFIKTNVSSQGVDYEPIVLNNENISLFTKIWKGVWFRFHSWFYIGYINFILTISIIFFIFSLIYSKLIETPELYPKYNSKNNHNIKKILKYCKFFIKTTVKLAVQNMKNRL